MPTLSTTEAKTPEQKTKLLLVDDNHSNLVTLSAVLPEREYELVFAHSGAEAIEIVKKDHDIALVLLDVQMPGLDGFETAKQLKAIEHARDIPIIFVTAIHKEDPFVKKGYAAGAIDYFGKPFDPEILRLKVRLYAAFRQKAILLQERERRIKETEALLETGRKLRGALETVPVGVLIADAEGRVRHVNREVGRIWGFTEPLDKDAYGEFLGWWEHDGALIKAEHGPMARTLQSGEPTRNQVGRIKCLDGAVKIVLYSTSPLHDLEGTIVGVVVVVQDVTQHKALENDMEQRVRSLISTGIGVEQVMRQ